MAKMKMELPTELIKEFNQLDRNCDKIFGEMTKAGAEVVEKNILKNVPENFKGSDIMNCLKITKTYKTPSDGGINTKVAFYGYFTNHRGIKTPAPLVCNVFEYGSSTMVKKPFLRRSFRKNEIEKAMLKKQAELTGGKLV